MGIFFNLIIKKLVVVVMRPQRVWVYKPFE